MKPNELRGMSDAHLTEVLTELHTEWRHLRFQEAVGKLTATARVREIRKSIARVHTIRRERELHAEAQVQLGETRPAGR